ncbi:hypothetical protein [Streptomyces sp. NBC_01236]|uniref:hypothetical protein n=1 Tax=Streptomyces sp. NBC_01236 TaxID=2903789 RepID=UPI002E10EAA6|nr:hypothetical protein OG324_40535 [Streptomyces sp. NBC_01236]
MSTVFRLWAGVLMVCALLLCLGGLARPAMAMPSGMEPMPTAASGDASGGAGTATAGRVDMDGTCPMGQQHCAKPSAAVPATAAAVPAALADAASPLPSASPWASQSRISPQAGPDPPPDLHRLCVQRT